MDDVDDDLSIYLLCIQHTRTLQTPRLQRLGLHPVRDTGAGKKKKYSLEVTHLLVLNIPATYILNSSQFSRQSVTGETLVICIDTEYTYLLLYLPAYLLHFGARAR